MDASRAVVRDAAREVGSSATQIWLWGQGVKPALPRFERRVRRRRAACRRRSTSCRGSVCSPVSKWSTFPGATAGFDNDYAAQARACLRSLADRDLFVLHVEATDEAGHQGLADVKVDALERWDADVIGPIVDALDAGSEPYRILLLPDHATPCTIKTHTAESVPYLLFDSTRDAAGGVYTEPATAQSAAGRRAHAHGPAARAGLTAASGGRAQDSDRRRRVFSRRLRGPGAPDGRAGVR